MSAAEGTYLERILAAKRSRLARERGQSVTPKMVDEALSSLPPTRDLAEALRRGAAPRIIAEFKRRSPSAGPLREDAEIEPWVQAYEDAGAAAVSVLCDEHFDGSLEDLQAAREACRLPVLCKDFILEKGQILEARCAGADAVLLIAAALPAPQLRPLVELAHELSLSVLCEAHDEHEIDRALSAGCKIVGVNARDLRTFEVDLDRAVRMRSLVPRSFTYVAESGIESLDDLLRLRDADVDAVLVGSMLMRADDPGAVLRQLVDGL
jgi:indole-3-glycerol phosphate synthase